MSNKVITYSSFDFDTLKADFITYLQSQSVFQDYNFAGSNANTIIEMVSGVGDLFNLFINAKANESYIDTAKLYQNINRLVKLTGYKPLGPRGSTVAITMASTFTLDEDDKYFTIPKFAAFTVDGLSPAGEEVKYSAIENTTFVGVAGSNIFSETVNLIQGIGDSELFSGDATEFQKLELTSDKAIEEYLEVWVNDELWSYVDDIYTEAVSTSKVYTTRFNKNQRVEILFGDGNYGVIPTLGTDNINVKYFDTLGSDGRIGANKITGIDDTIYVYNYNDVQQAQTITFTITQTSESDGGSEMQTVDQIANYSPGAIRSQKRIVTDQDTIDKLLAKYDDYIYECSVLNADEYFSATGESPATSAYNYNNIFLYPLPKYATTLTAGLKLAIYDYLNTYKMSTLEYVIKDVNFYNIDVLVNYYHDTESTQSASQTEAAISTYLSTYFSRGNRDMGENIKYSKILSGLQDLSGVSSLTMGLSGTDSSGWEYGNIQLSAVDFPKLNTVTINKLTP